MKEIKELLKDVAKKYNLDLSKEEAIKNNKDKYLTIDFASCYGGYRLVMVDVKNGGHYGVFGQSSCCSRISKKEMVCYLNGLANN